MPHWTAWVVMCEKFTMDVTSRVRHTPLYLRPALPLELCGTLWKPSMPYRLCQTIDTSGLDRLERGVDRLRRERIATTVQPRRLSQPDNQPRETTITDNSRMDNTYYIESNDPEAVADAIQKRQEDQRRTRIGARGRQVGRDESVKLMELLIPGTAMVSLSLDDNWWSLNGFPAVTRKHRSSVKKTVSRVPHCSPWARPRYHYLFRSVPPGQPTPDRATDKSPALVEANRRVCGVTRAKSGVSARSTSTSGNTSWKPLTWQSQTRITCG